MKRTHFCGELRKEHIGETIILNGWVAKSRDLGPLLFIDIRDKTGICQIVFKKEENEELYLKAKELKSEYVIGIKGKVFGRENKIVK